MARLFTSTSVDTTLSATLLSGATTCAVVSASALLGTIQAAQITPGNTFTIAINPDTQSEEICVVTAVTSNTLTITRALAGTVAQDHQSGSLVRHVLTSMELTEFEQSKGSVVNSFMLMGG
jgi:hypothetical protein